MKKLSEIDHLSYSSISAYLYCPRSWKYKYLESIPTIASPEQHFNTGVNILISDGQPDSEEEALKIAKTYQNHIDVIYVGPESSPSGREFLKKLAQASGGQAITADRAKELAASIEKLLLRA